MCIKMNVVLLIGLGYYILYIHSHTGIKCEPDNARVVWGEYFFFFLVLNGPTTLEIKFDFLLIGKEKKDT